ncbi:MAG: hypothetical protein ACFFBP_07440 [Promethearchaeota archaeon]
MARKKKEEKQIDLEPKYAESIQVKQPQGVILKDGNKEGLSVLVELIEEVDVKQDHYSNINSIGFNGKLSIENPSQVDRLWDIDIVFKNIESTNLKSNEIKIRELGINEDEKSNTQEFQLTGDIKNLVLIKEYVNTNPNADEILNPTDIKNDLFKLKEKVSDVEVETIGVKEEEIKELVEDKAEVEEEIFEETVEEIEEVGEEILEEIDEELDDFDDTSGEEKEKSSEELIDLDKDVEFQEEDEEKQEFEQWSLEELQEYCEDNLIDIPDEATKDEIIEKIREAEEEMLEGGMDIDEFSLESYGISIKKTNEITFAVALHSLYEKTITNVKVVKNIPPEFNNVNIRSSSIGSAEIDNNQIIWSIEELEPETTQILKFTCDIFVESLDPVKTGMIDITYKASSSFSGGLSIEKFEGFTHNKYFIDMVEKDEEPGVWDCNLVFQNLSEFMIELFNVNVNDPTNPDQNLISFPEDQFPRLPAGAQWLSEHWEYESENYPSFKKKLEFRVMPTFQTNVNGIIAIDDIDLVLASITGTISYEAKELPIGIEEEENVIIIPSYKESEIEAQLIVENNGSAPLNEVTLTQKDFTDEFKPPNSEELKLLWDGKEIDLDPESVIINNEEIKVTLNNLKDSQTGMFEPNSTIKLIYPIYAESPSKDTEFETNAIYTANTYPKGPELEFIPIPEKIPIIKVVHIRRKYRVGKEIIPIGNEGNYQIILSYQNVGEIPLRNFILLDKVPDNFKYKNFSMEPTEITDEVGTDTLKWIIKSLEKEEVLEIKYEISGSGEYHASDAQLSP